MRGSVTPGVPANVSLMYPTGHRDWGNPRTAGFIGTSHAPMQLVAKNPLARADAMTLQGITLERLEDRYRLLKAVDGFRRDVDTSGVMEGVDTFTQQAVNVLTSTGLVEALDLSREDLPVLSWPDHLPGQRTA